MTPIYPPDLFALRAAEGWIELGNPAEALLELSVVTAANEDHPAILETGWSACAASGDWAAGNSPTCVGPARSG